MPRVHISAYSSFTLTTYPAYLTCTSQHAPRLHICQACRVSISQTAPYLHTVCPACPPCPMLYIHIHHAPRHAHTMHHAHVHDITSMSLRSHTYYPACPCVHIPACTSFTHTTYPACPSPTILLHTYLGCSASRLPPPPPSTHTQNTLYPYSPHLPRMLHAYAPSTAYTYVPRMLCAHTISFSINPANTRHLTTHAPCITNPLLADNPNGLYTGRPYFTVQSPPSPYKEIHSGAYI